MIAILTTIAPLALFLGVWWVLVTATRRRQSRGRSTPNPDAALRLGVVLLLGGMTLAAGGLVAGSGQAAAAGFAFAAVQAAVLVIRRRRGRAAAPAGRGR